MNRRLSTTKAYQSRRARKLVGNSRLTVALAGVAAAFFAASLWGSGGALYTVQWWMLSLVTTFSSTTVALLYLAGFIEEQAKQAAHPARLHVVRDVPGEPASPTTASTGAPLAVPVRPARQSPRWTPEVVPVSQEQPVSVVAAAPVEQGRPAAAAITSV